MGYNVKNNKVGFPVNSLEKVISVFSKMKVSIYVDNMLFEFGNNYKKYLDEYKSKFEVEWLMNDLNKSIKEILKRDSTLDEIRSNDNKSNAYGILSNWFVQTINSKYNNYLSKDAVYCNDRELASGYSYSLNGNFNFKAYDRLEKNKKPTYYCTNNKDAFSLNNTETKFTLAVGLMTADEVIFAGGSVAEEMSYPFTWYYNNATDGQSIIDADGFWTMTPSDYNGGTADIYYVNYSVLNGGLSADGVNLSNIATRPVISLKSCILWSKENGSATSPYEIIENGGC